MFFYRLILKLYGSHNLQSIGLESNRMWTRNYLVFLLLVHAIKCRWGHALITGIPLSCEVLSILYYHCVIRFY